MTGSSKYRVTFHECDGAARYAEVVTANSREEAAYAASGAFVPRTGLAAMVAGITGTRWEVVSVERASLTPLPAALRESLFPFGPFGDQS